MNVLNTLGTSLMGFLIIAEDGAILASGGDLENDEKTGNILFKMFNLAPNVDPSLPKNSFQRLTIAYEEFAYVVCLSNRKFYVAKKKL